MTITADMRATALAESPALAGPPAFAGPPAPAEPPAPAGPPALDEAEGVNLYQAIGGRPALAAAVDGLFGRLLADPELAPFFPGGVGERHRRYVVTFLAEALGGPHRYRGRGMAESHGGLAITGAQFERTAAHLAATLDELGVPAGLAGQVVAAVAGLRPAIVTA